MFHLKRRSVWQKRSIQNMDLVDAAGTHDLFVDTIGSYISLL